MKAFRLFTLGAIALALPAMAQAPLSPEQIEQLRGASLYVEEIERTYVTPGYRPEGAVYAAPIISRSRTWYAYQGDEQITEEAFYSLTGRDDLLATLRSRRTTRTLLVLGGVAAAAAGGVLTYRGLEGEEVTEPPLFPGDTPFVTRESNYALVGAGSAVLLAGSFSIGAGFRLGQKRATHAQAAARLANAYNVRLEAELRAPRPEDAIRDAAPRP